MWRIIAAAVILWLLLFIGLALLIDVRDGLERARTLSAAVAYYAVWISLGFAGACWAHPKNRRNGRLVLLMLVLSATGLLLFLKTDAYKEDIVPGVVEVLLLTTPGAILGWFGSGSVEWLSPQPPGGRPNLWIVIGIGLLAAAPWIVSPVVENWNASGWMDSHSYDVFAHNILSGKARAGSSQYMPVYQYGMAFVYYLFGHFFFAQQIVNVVLACGTIVLLGLAAWNLFRNPWAVLLIVIWTAFLRPFVYPVHFTQIESWYVPIVALTIFAWTCYWRTPSKLHLIGLALAAGLGINTRNQGAFYFGWLCLAPLFVDVLPRRSRFVHAILAVSIVAVSLVPWSIRNYVVDGRFSPSAARNSYYLAILNDPRIGLYGVRYWDGWTEIKDEYDQKYPDAVVRDRVMLRDGLTAPFRHPRWFGKALVWRAAAFYGVMPPGDLDTEKRTPVDWSAEWKAFVYWKIAPLILLPLSVIGLLTRFKKETAFIAIAILANLAAALMAPSAEDRVSYPVLPLHMLLALGAVFAVQQHESDWSAFRSAWRSCRPATWLLLTVGAAVFMVESRTHFGRSNLYAPLSEARVFLASPLEIDERLWSLNEFAASQPEPPNAPDALDGARIRLRLIAYNYQWPPKFGGRVAWMPPFSTDPLRENYYMADLMLARRDAPVRIGVSWFGAEVSEPLREGDEVEAEGRLIAAPGDSFTQYWVRLEKARKVTPRTSEIPAFY